MKLEWIIAYTAMALIFLGLRSIWKGKKQQ